MNNEILIGIIFFILGLIPAYYFYKKSIRVKEPVFSIKSNNLIAGSSSIIEKLTVLYDGAPVENVTASRILFYNKGQETITRQDIQTKIPLGIEIPSVRLLDFKLLQVNNESNNISLKYNLDSDRIDIDFDYLDHGQGLVMQVVHTGLSSDDLVIDGSIIGVEKLREVESYQFVVKREMKLNRQLLLASMTIMAITFLPFTALWGEEIVQMANQGILGFLVALWLVFGAASTIVLMFALTNYMFARAKEWLSVAIPIPKGLEKFGE